MRIHQSGFSSVKLAVLSLIFVASMINAAEAKAAAAGRYFVASSSEERENANNARHPSRQMRPVRTVPSSRSVRNYLAGKLFKFTCKGGDNASNTYGQLRRDGKVGFNYKVSRNFKVDGTDFWTAKNGIVRIRWTNGFAIDEFRFSYDKLLHGGPVYGPRLKLCPTMTMRIFGAGRRIASPPPRSSPRKYLAGKIFKYTCKDGDASSNKYGQLRADGKVGYNYKKPNNFKYKAKGADTWTLKNGVIRISWTNGYAIEEFRFSYDKLLHGRPVHGPRTKRCPTMTMRIFGAGSGVARPSPREYLAGKIFKYTCKGGDSSSNKYGQLRADGKVGFNHKQPRNFKVDGTDFWTVKNGIIRISWTNGYAIEEFRFSYDKLLHGRPVHGPRMQKCPTMTMRIVR